MVNPTSYNENYKRKSEVFELNNINQQSATIYHNNEEDRLIADFNKEGEKVKSILQNNFEDAIFSVAENFKNHYSIKDNIIVNQNKYIKNSHNAKKLEQQISDLQYVDSKINSSQSHSLRDFFSEVKNAIVCGKNDYLDILKDIFSNYMNYVNDLRGAISTVSQYTKAGEKNGNISVNFLKIYNELNEVKKKYQNMVGETSFFSTNILFKYQKDGSYRREINGQHIIYLDREQSVKSIHAIEKILKDVKGITLNIANKNDKLVASNIELSIESKNNLNFDDLFLKENGDINIGITCNVDFSEFNKLIKFFNPYLRSEGVVSDDELEEKRRQIIEYNNNRIREVSLDKNLGIALMSPEIEILRIKRENERIIKETSIYHSKLQHEFDLFKKSLDTLEKKINTNLDELSKKYSAANSNYDNFVKIVSSTMNTLLEMAKGFLRF